jgi:hypothetical protein
LDYRGCCLYNKAVFIDFTREFSSISQGNFHGSDFQIAASKSLRVTFRENSEGTNIVMNLIKRESSTFDLIRRGKFTTIADDAKRLSVAHSTMESTVRKLRDKDLIGKVGSSKAGR